MSGFSDRFFGDQVFPLGFSLWFEIHANDKGGTFIKVQFKIPPAKTFEKIFLRTVTEPVEFLPGEFGDFMKIDSDAFLHTGKQCTIDPAVDILEPLVHFFLGRFPFQFPAQFRFIIISESVFNPHG